MYSLYMYYICEESYILCTICLENCFDFKCINICLESTFYIQYVKKAVFCIILSCWESCIVFWILFISCLESYILYTISCFQSWILFTYIMFRKLYSVYYIMLKKLYSVYLNHVKKAVFSILHISCLKSWILLTHIMFRKL